ncbi:MAG: hypothetical protein GMKNLPBB_01701 [Myxococcota bacterium]|nr:hypothetical protein [Myxococcota bacterium]
MKTWIRAASILLLSVPMLVGCGRSDLDAPCTPGIDCPLDIDRLCPGGVCPNVDPDAGTVVDIDGNVVDQDGDLVEDAGEEDTGFDPDAGQDEDRFTVSPDVDKDKDGIDDKKKCTVRADCTANPEFGSDYFCDNGECRRILECNSDSDCEPGPEGEPTECLDGRCVRKVCRGPDDCFPTEICSAGRCRPKPPSDNVVAVRILTPPGTIAPNEKKQLQAIATDQEGKIIPGQEFEWFSTETGVAAINQSSGQMTGGKTAGTTQVTARLKNKPEILSPPVAFTNPGEPKKPNGVRVVVTNTETGKPLSGSIVEIEHAGGVGQQLTGNDGTAFFENINPPLNVLSVFNPDFTFVTAYSVNARDIAVPLKPNVSDEFATGITGKMDFSEIREGDIFMGFGGVSISGELVGLDLTKIIGGPINTEIPFFQGAQFPVPGGTVFGLGDTLAIKTEVFALGDPGLRAAWALGGKLSSATLLPLINSALEGGVDIPTILRQTLPLLNTFRHDVKPNIELKGLPLVADPKDLDGDGDRNDKVPDYKSFPKVNLKPAQRLLLKTRVEVPILPRFQGKLLEGVIILGGTKVEGWGTVPLGLTGGLDQNQSDEFRDGQVQPLDLRFAPNHSGLEIGEYYVVVLATSFEVDFQSNTLGMSSGRISITSRLPETVVFQDGFLGLPEGSQYDGRTRNIRLAKVQSAHFYRMNFRQRGGKQWDVYLPANVPPTVVLPKFQGDDRAAGARIKIDTIRLKPGNDMNTLFAFNGRDLNVLERLTDAFSVLPITR